MRYRYLDDFRRGISVLGTPQCPALSSLHPSLNSAIRKISH